MRYKLKELRQHYGLSLEAMALICGIGKMAYWKIEQNKSDGSFTAWMFLKMQYGLSDEHILDLYRENTKPRKLRGNKNGTNKKN